MAPIVLFTYNRPEHLKNTVSGLKKCVGANRSELYVFSDGPREGLTDDKDKVGQVREYLKALSGFKSCLLTVRDTNFGLARSVISGVSEVLKIHECVIVVEDDLSFHPNYLEFMNSCLRKHVSNVEIGSVSGYVWPFPRNKSTPGQYLLPRASSWGWGTWADRWHEVNWKPKLEDFFGNPEKIRDFNRGGEDLTAMLKKRVLKKNDSWAVLWCYYHFLYHKSCLYPSDSFIKNHGTDGSGTHSPATDFYTSDFYDGETMTLIDNPQEDPERVYQLQKFFKLSPFRRVVNRFKLGI